MTPAQQKAKKRYDEKNTVQIKLKLNRKTDKDILEELEHSGNKQGFIKGLIRHSIKEKEI